MMEEKKIKMTRITNNITTSYQHMTPGRLGVYVVNKNRGGATQVPAYSSRQVCFFMTPVLLSYHPRHPLAATSFLQIQDENQQGQDGE